VILLKHERQIVGGEYYFDRPMNVYQVARRLTMGDFQIEQLKTTVPEGSTTFDISNILLKNYSDFDSHQHLLPWLCQKKAICFPTPTNLVPQ
jgi:cell division protein YceG involved in septum cleavage